MLSLPFHIVLLFAVACSQIFGGVSCCCFSRTLIAGLSATHEVASATEFGQATAKVLPVPRCPKCAASQASAVRRVNAKELQGCSVTESSDCQCSKASSSATLQFEPRTPSITMQFVATPTATRDLTRPEERAVARRHKVPIRFGGHSWQSMACIWKK